MHQRRTGNTARLLVVRQRDIVRHNHHLHLQAVAFGLFCRQTKIQAVTGVIFDDQQAAAIARDRHNGIQHRIHARRGKQVATYRRREHPFSDKPSVRRFVAGTPTGDHRYAAFIPVTARNNSNGRINIKLDEVSVRSRNQNAFNSIVDQLFAIIKKESGHTFPKCCEPYAKA